MAHEISVGEYAEKLVVLAGDNGSASAHAGHRPKHVTYRRVGRDNCHRFARPHDLMNAHQHASADHAARMKFGEIFLIKAARLQEHHGQRVAQRQHHCRARRRRQV